LGNEILVNQTTSGTQQTPSVATSGTSFSVAWQGSAAADSAGIYFRQFDASGAALTAEALVNTTTANTQKTPTIAALNGGLVIAWSGAGNGDTAGVFEQRYTNYSFTVNSLADSVDANPGDGIAADSLGRTTLRAAIMEANAL